MRGESECKAVRKEGHGRRTAIYLYSHSTNYTLPPPGLAYLAGGIVMSAQLSVTSFPKSFVGLFSVLPHPGYLGGGISSCNKQCFVVGESGSWETGSVCILSSLSYFCVHTYASRPKRKTQRGTKLSHTSPRARWDFPPCSEYF